MTERTVLNTDMDKAICELADAVAYHQQAVTRTRQAQQAETTAMNRLNNAQKAIDKIVEALRQMCPGDSDWRRKSYAVRDPLPSVNPILQPSALPINAPPTWAERASDCA